MLSAADGCGTGFRIVPATGFLGGDRLCRIETESRWVGEPGEAEVRGGEAVTAAMVLADGPAHVE